MPRACGRGWCGARGGLLDDLGVRIVVEQAFKLQAPAVAHGDPAGLVGGEPGEGLARPADEEMLPDRRALAAEGEPDLDDADPVPRLLVGIRLALGDLD